MKKALIIYLISIIAMTTFLSGCNSELKSEELLNVLGDKLELSSEMIELSAREDIIKIDCIQPGLYTENLRVILYSLSKQKQLCEVDLGEDAWNTGLTNDGFYAISLLRQEIVVYGLNGSEISRQKITDAGDSWAFGILNETADYLLFGHSRNAQIIRYSLKDGKQTVVGKFTGYIAELGCRDNKFYLHNAEGELLRIGIDDEAMESVYYDPAIRLHTKDYGIGTVDTSFLAVSAQSRYKTDYVQMTSIDEIELAAYQHGFATLVSTHDNDLLRIYDISKKDVLEVPINARVQQVVFRDEDTLLISAKDESGKNLLYYCNLSKAEITPMAFQAESSARSNSVSGISEQSLETIHVQNGTLIKNVPVIAQMPSYPTGCESVSAVMALRFAGEHVSVDEFIDNHLEKSSNFYFSNGKKYGPNPWEHFIGNPRSKASYGCMAPVIERALKSYLGNEERVLNTTGMTLDELCREYIDNGIPVMVWTSINMIDTYPSNTWTLADGKTYTWTANEHCMVLIGYDEQNYYFNDPYKGKQVKFGKLLSQKRSETFERQSLIVLSNK